MAVLHHSNQYIFVVLVVITSASQIASRVISHESMSERHEKWMTDVGRRYDNAIDKEERYQIFKANAEYIDAVNKAATRPYKLSINQFADITNEEFKSTYISYAKPLTTKSSPPTSFPYQNLTVLPPSIDWRKKGAVTRIRNGSCGAWTFPAVDTVEGINKIKSGTLYTLSVQEIVDCSGAYGGCSGGVFSNAFDFIKQNGLTSETTYPSKDKMGTCDVKKEAEPVAKISGYEYLPPDNEEALMVAVAKQPVAASVDASGVDFQFYSSGVFTGQCGTELDHGVTVVGYGSEEGKIKYWIIRNSWGSAWGEGGYMKLQKDVDQKEGLCGVAMEAMYPLL